MYSRINNVVHFIRYTKSIEFRFKCPKHYQNISFQNSKKKDTSCSEKIGNYNIFDSKP